MRKAFIDTLSVLAEKNKNLFLLTGDLGFSVFEDFIKKYPDQYLNCGVAEQNMMGVAAGLALSGKKVFVYSIVPFATMRPFEQVRNDICLNDADVKIIGVGGGYSYGQLGPTHHSTEDIAIMKALPNMRVLVPADPVETELLVKAIAEDERPAYLRLGKSKEENLHNAFFQMEVGKSNVLREGKDLTVFGIGPILYNAIKAAEILDKEDISCRVVSMGSVKPLDLEAVVRFGMAGPVVTIEEHSIIGGIGDSIASAMLEAGLNAGFMRLGAKDEFVKITGDQEYLRAENGLSPEKIAASISVFYGGNINKKNKMTEKIQDKLRRRFLDIIAPAYYWPMFLKLRSALFYKKTHGEANITKLGERRDLISPEFIKKYEEILAWQRGEQNSIKVDKDSCRPELYEKISSAYAARSSHQGKPGRSRNFKYEMIWETIWPVMHLDLKPGMKVADIGAENSCLTPYFASLGAESYGLDAFIGGYGEYFRKEVLDKCENGTLVLDVRGKDGGTHKARYKREDGANLSFPDNFFDRITCISTIEHLFKDQEAMKETGRVLKPGGILALTTPFGLAYSENNFDGNSENVYNDADHVYTEKAVKERLLDPSGLKIIGWHDFSLSKKTWRKYHFPGENSRFVSVALFLRKGPQA